MLNQLQLLFDKPELWSGPLLLGIKFDQNCNNQVRRSLSLHVSQIILSLSRGLIEKRQNYQNKGPICRRIGKALRNLMKYLKCPCDNHVRRHCLITRASKLASNWFTWNAGGIFLALYICFLLDQRNEANEVCRAVNKDTWLFEPSYLSLWCPVERRLSLIILPWFYRRYLILFMALDFMAGCLGGLINLHVCWHLSDLFSAGIM